MIFNFWRSLLKNDVTKKNRNKKLVLEDSRDKSQKWYFKMVMASFLRSVVSKFSLWLFNFWRILFKNDVTKKVIFRLEKLVSKKSLIKCHNHNPNHQVKTANFRQAKENSHIDSQNKTTKISATCYQPISNKVDEAKPHSEFFKLY